MAYLWLKALHVAAVMAWAGSLINLPLALTGAEGPGAAAERVRSAYKIVANPAALLSILLGFSIFATYPPGAMTRRGWLVVKLAVVGVLIVEHLYLGRRIEAARQGRPLGPRGGAVMTIVAAACALAIVALVVLKPF